LSFIFVQIKIFCNILNLSQIEVESHVTLFLDVRVAGKRGLVLSRSTYVGSGRWVAHWLGDNWSNWANLRYSIIGMLQFNQAAYPLDKNSYWSYSILNRLDLPRSGIVE
jgi:alpha-glucosidase (family GH31 glycosyl hydrolase)